MKNDLSAIVGNTESKPEKVFTSRQQETEFRRAFSAAIMPKLEVLRQKRLASEEAAKRYRLPGSAATT